MSVGNNNTHMNFVQVEHSCFTIESEDLLEKLDVAVSVARTTNYFSVIHHRTCML